MKVQAHARHENSIGIGHCGSASAGKIIVVEAVRKLSTVSGVCGRYQALIGTQLLFGTSHLSNIVDVDLNVFIQLSPCLWSQSRCPRTQQQADSLHRHLNCVLAMGDCRRAYHLVKGNIKLVRASRVPMSFRSDRLLRAGFAQGSDRLKTAVNAADGTAPAGLVQPSHDFA